MRATAKQMAAHRRLMEYLPVRKHLIEGEKLGAPKGTNTTSKPILIGEEFFFGISHASRHFKKGRKVIYEWLRSGKARYV